MIILSTLFLRKNFKMISTFEYSPKAIQEVTTTASPKTISVLELLLTVHKI